MQARIQWHVHLPYCGQGPEQVQWSSASRLGGTENANASTAEQSMPIAERRIERVVCVGRVA
eukprot:4633935-Prymnesium_polylepis.1